MTGEHTKRKGGWCYIVSLMLWQRRRSKEGSGTYVSMPLPDLVLVAVVVVKVDVGGDVTGGWVVVVTGGSPTASTQ